MELQHTASEFLDGKYSFNKPRTAQSVRATFDQVANGQLMPHGKGRGLWHPKQMS